MRAVNLSLVREYDSKVFGVRSTLAKDLVKIIGIDAAILNVAGQMDRELIALVEREGFTKENSIFEHSFDGSREVDVMTGNTNLYARLKVTKRDYLIDNYGTKYYLSPPRPSEKYHSIEPTILEVEGTPLTHIMYSLPISKEEQELVDRVYDSLVVLNGGIDRNEVERIVHSVYHDYLQGGDKE